MTHTPVTEERRSVKPRSAAAGPGAFPVGRLEAGELEAGRLEAGELEAFGLRALNSIGVRLAQIFLITALIGVPLAASANQAGRALVPAWPWPCARQASPTSCRGREGEPG